MRNTKEKILSILMLLALVTNNLLYPINYVTAENSGDVEIIGTSIENKNLDIELDIPVSDYILDLKNPENVLEENGNNVTLSGDNEELIGNDSILSGNNEELTGNDTVLSGDNGELTGDDTVLNGNESSLTPSAEDFTGNIEESIGGDETGKSLDELERIRETLNDTEISGQETYKKITVNVKSPAGTFPEGVELRISPITTKNEIKEIKEQIVDSQNNVEEEPELVAFDIAFLYTLSDGTEVELQPKDGESVQVTFDYSNNKTFKKAEADDNQTIEVYHINDKNENGEKVEKGEETVEKIEINQVASTEVDNGLVINAECFSVYVLVLSDDDTITLTLDPGEGSILSGENITINEETGTGTILSDGGNVTLPLAVRENNEFLGWNTVGESFAGSGGDSYEITGDITLYAKWEQEGEGVTYTVTFDANRGTFADTPASQNVSGGEYVTDPATLSGYKEPELPGYTFTGWWTEPRGGTQWDFGNDLVTGNITLYAHWIYDLPYGDLDVYMIDSSGSLIKYVMMDRNMGATGVYNKDFDSQNPSSFGFVYQWGNNYGFPRCNGNGTCNYSPITDTQVSVDIVENYIPSKFASSTWIGKNGSNPTNKSWHLNSGNILKYLWGNGNATDMQGPCPDGYHVPSTSETNDEGGLFGVWSNIYDKTINTIASKGSGFSFLSDDQKLFTFQFLFPHAGNHKKGNTKEQEQNMCGDYWTATPSGTENAINMWFCKNGDNKYYDENGKFLFTNNSQRNNGSTLRCFKNSTDSANLDIVNGGKKGLITVHKVDGVTTINAIKEPENTDANGTGLIFEGWYTSPNFEPSTMKTGGDVLSPSVTALYAKWDCPDGLVYNSDNECISGVLVRFIDEETEYTRSVVLSGEEVRAPATNPEKAGYIFTGWFESGANLPFVFTGTPITGNLDLYAHWDINNNKYDVNVSVITGDEDKGYLSGMGSTGISLTGLYNYGTELVFIAVPKLGYVFDYWMNGDQVLSGTDLGDGRNQLTVFVDQVLDIIAFFKETPTPYTVEHYQENLGQTGYDFVWSGTMYGIANKQTNVTGTNYTGFILSGDLASYQTGINSDGSTVVRLYYNRGALHTVTFENWNGDFLWSGKVASGETPTYNGSNPSRPATEQYIYTFDGWYPELSPATMDTTYTAIYRESPRLYTVTLTGTPAGYGTLTPESLSKEYGAAIVISGDKLTVGGTEVILSGNEGYEFQEWTGTCGKVEKQVCDEHIIYSHSDPIEFTGGNNLIITNPGYDLFSESNYQKDFEISFDIVNQDLNNSESQATILNVKDEDQNNVWPGIAIRKSSSAGKIEITATSNYGKGYKTSKNYSLENLHSIKISRINSILYVSINGSENEQLYDYSGFNAYFTKPIVFGSSYKDEDHLLRPAKITLSNILIKSIDTCYTGNVYAVTGDCQMTAVFSSSGEYPVTIASNNAEYGTVSSSIVRKPYGTTITVNGNTLDIGGTIVTATTGTAPEGHTYTFSGWTFSSECESGGNYKVLLDCEVTANFSSSVNNYTITWNYKDANGEDVIYTGSFTYGEIPSHSVPSYYETEQTGYTFSGWTPELTGVVGPATYFAVYTETPRNYKVSFAISPTGYGILNPSQIIAEYGSQIITEGNTLTVGNETVTATVTGADEQYTYVFVEWTGNCGNTLTHACTITAIFDKILNNYEITWIYMDGNLESVTETGVLPYGSMPNHDNPPYYETNATGYTFSGWNPELTGVVGEQTYTAIYNGLARKYNLTVTSADITRGTVSPTSGLFDYGSTVTLTATAKTGYSFSRWIKVESGVETEISTGSPYEITITGNTEIKAEFGYGQTTYKVKHYKQNVNGNDYESPEIEILYGITNNTTTATAKSYTGFRDPGNIEQKTILADGSTEVKIYYYRDSYNVYWNYTVDGSEGSQDGQSMTSEENYLYGQIPEYKNISGYKTVSKVYTFNGWYDGGYHTYFVGENLPEVTGQVTYTAQYSDVRREYTGIFYDENGETPLYTGHQNYGDIWIYWGVTPTKESTAQYSYSFYGWKDGPNFYSSGSLPTVTSDQNFTAVFDEVVNEYLITFVDEGGNELWSNYFPYGQIPVYGGELPTKEQTISTVYTFNGWRKGDSEFQSGVGLPIVDGTGTYTVIFSETPRQYEISFVDRDGTGLSGPILYNYGSGVDEIDVPKNPERPDTDEYLYTFSGWNPELTGTVVGDQVYTAVYTETKKTYEVTFTVSPTGYGILNPLQIIAEYGSPITTSGNELTVGTGTVTATPVTGDAQYTYNFIGWTGDCGDILTHQCTITALFDKTINEYEITWSYKDANGESTGETETVAYNVVPTHAATATYTVDHRVYTFASWTPTPVAATGNTTYTATYTNECEAGYHEDGELCVAEKIGVCTMPENVITNATYTTTGAYIWANGQWNKPECTFVKCNGGYHQVGQTCVSNEDIVTQCNTGTRPANTVITAGTFVQKWTGTGFLPETKEWTYNGVECGFTCDTNYHRDGSICTSDSGVLPCDGTGTPENATAVMTVVNVSWDPTLNNGSGGWTEPVACEWNCNATYHKLGDTCVSNDDLVVNCDSATRPANTVITTGTFVQKWTGTGFLPETKEWTYNGEECGFVCATNYSRNGSVCVSDSGQGGQGNGSSSTNSSHQDTFRRDRCPRGDYSDSYYDGDCGVSIDDEIWHTHGSAAGDADTLYEYYNSYEWAYTNKIIGKTGINIDGFERTLTRIETARLLSNFAMNVLGMVPDESRTIVFKDVSRYLDKSFNESVSIAYKLGIMGINMPKNRFIPFGVVSRAEFVTALSRMMYGTVDGTDIYYSTHINLMNDLGVIQNVTPDMKETLGYVLIMLKRASDLRNLKN